MNGESCIHQPKTSSSHQREKGRNWWLSVAWKELPFSPTTLLNLCPPKFDVSETTGHFCPFVCNLPWGCYSMECLPGFLLCSGYEPGPWRQNREWITEGVWIHGPYSWREKARLWSQMNFSCKILVPPFFQLGDLQRVIRFSLNFLFSYL